AAAVQTVKTWSADLVARRRRLRIAVLALNIVSIALVAGSGFTSAPITGLGASGSLVTALGLFVLAMLVGFGFFGAKAAVPTIDATAAIASGDARGGTPIASRDAADRDAIDPILLRRLDHLMSVERIYRQEGLSIGVLAARLDLQEYRLRQAINEGLGYR